MSGILPDLSSQSVLSHNWLLLFLFVHVLTSRERGAFGGCGGHIERQGEALGREDQLQTYQRRFGDEEEDSMTSTTDQNFILVQKLVKSGLFPQNLPFFSWLCFSDDLLIEQCSMTIHQVFRVEMEKNKEQNSSSNSSGG